MPKKKIRIIIADDHKIVRSGLRTLFSRSPDLSIVGEAGDGEEAVNLARRVKPDLAILDITMPNLNGLEAARAIKTELTGVKVLILTIHEEEEYVYEMIKAEADGYVLKNADRKEILEAVHAVAAGGPFFSPGISNLFIDRFIKRVRQEQTVPDKGPRLTKRETEVLRLIAQGLSSKEIGEKLFLSTSTVNTHRTNLMQKLDIHETAGLIRYAIKANLINI